jgi:hypothetical protein
MREIKIDDQTYQIKALPTRLMPYAGLWPKLMAEVEKTQNLADAQKHSDLEKVTEEILNATVKPKADPNHEIPLVALVIAYTGEQTEAYAKFFRADKTVSGPSGQPTEEHTRKRP